MLLKVRNALRITGEDFDEEIKTLISSAREDLILSGVDRNAVYNDDIELIKNTIISYCKSYFGYDNPESEKFRKNYELARIKLTLSYPSKK